MLSLHAVEKILLNGYFLTGLAVIAVALTVRGKVSIKGPRYAMALAWLFFVGASVEITEGAANRPILLGSSVFLSFIVCAGIAIWMRPAAGKAATAIPQITIAPTFNNSPVISTNISPNVASVGTQPPVSQAPPEPRAVPNLIFLRTRVIRVTYEPNNGNELFYESRVIDNHDPRAVIACFRNEPTVRGRVLDARHVRAQIVYRDNAGQEIGNGIPRACWLDDPMDLVHFHVGESHCAILLFANPDGALYVPWKRRQNTGYGDVVTTQVYEFGEQAISTIEIRVLSDNNDLLLEPVVFEFSMVHDAPEVRERGGSE